MTWSWPYEFMSFLMCYVTCFLSGAVLPMVACDGGLFLRMATTQHRLVTHHAARKVNGHFLKTLTCCQAVKHFHMLPCLQINCMSRAGAFIYYEKASANFLMRFNNLRVIFIIACVHFIIKTRLCVHFLLKVQVKYFIISTIITIKKHKI